MLRSTKVKRPTPKEDEVVACNVAGAVRLRVASCIIVHQPLLTASAGHGVHLGSSRMRNTNERGRRLESVRGLAEKLAKAGFVV
jgi:hypothetical protein